MKKCKVCGKNAESDYCFQHKPRKPILKKKMSFSIHKQTREERLQLLKQARKIQFENKQNPLVHCSRNTQSERGKRGGPKNKGFVWVTDGTCSIKYTKKLQQSLSVDAFLQKNKTYRRGRTLEK